MFKLNIFLLGIAFIITRSVPSLGQEDAGTDYEDYENGNGVSPPADPCSEWHQGDKDLNLLDAYTRNRFQESRHKDLQNVAQVRGPTAYHVAYHIEERMNMTIETVQAFPNGVPYMFSFETTFRSSFQYTQPWYLFVIYSEHYEQEISVVINPLYQTVELSIPQIDGGLQRVHFSEETLFDQRWHKLMFGLTDDSVRLWVDCAESPSTAGLDRGQLNQRGQISSNGYFSIAQDVRTGRTVVVELQGMSMSCDVEKPGRTTCEELPGYDVLPTEPDSKLRGDIPIENVTHPFIPEERDRGQCPVQCPRGPPGYNGANGLQGPPGLPGPPGVNAYIPPQGVVQKGEKGERGSDGFGYPGPTGPPGIPGASLNYPPPAVFNGTKGDKGERGDDGIQGERGFTGPQGPPGPPGAINFEGISQSAGEEYYQPGPPGIPGAPGSPGDRGIKGERGDTGLTGGTGLPGLNGIPGFKGDKGHTGEQGLEGKPGPQGLRGEMGYPGVPGPRGERGLEGQCTCQEQPGSLIVGPRGPQGVPGPQGNDGLPGIPGGPGQRGPPGTPGETSSIPSELNLDDKRIRDICLEVVKEYLAEMASQLVGPQGPPGKTRIGKPGPRGPVGSAGEPGERGPQGERGYQGMPGIPGSRGDVGAPGKNGLNGERGEKGDAGIGLPGNPGIRGYPGVPGRDGYPGPTGERGEAGRTGDEGPRGPPGQAGECPDCSAYSAAYYPYMYQGNSKGPAYSEKG